MVQDPSALPYRRYLPLHSIEQRVRAELARGEVSGAATTAVAFFGPEIYGFVTTALAGGRGVLEVYTNFVAELQRALPGFGWRCELRVFAYYLARAALRQHRHGAAAGGHRASPPPLTAGLVRLPPHRRTRRLAVAMLRSALPPDDRELLVLRLDRRLRWRDLALTGLGEAASEATLEEEARRLRERFRALRRRMLQLTRPDEAAREVA